MVWMPVVFLILLHRVCTNSSNPSHVSYAYPTPVPSTPSPPQVFSHLLPPTFFQHFQRNHVHISAKDREPGWRNLVMSLTPVLEEVLSVNVTTCGQGPLRLNHDVTLHTLDIKTGKKHTVERISNSPIVPPSITSVFDDGFSLTVHRIEHRMSSLNTLTASLAQAFRVKVTADYTIYSAGTGASISAQDEIHIILSGTCIADVHEGVFRYPLQEHIEDVDAIKASQNGGTTIRLNLAPGDLLYLPRGDRLTVSGISLLTIRLHTDEITYTDVLNTVIDVGSVREDSPLTDPLPESEGEYSYVDLLKELVKLGAEATEDLRKHFVVGESVREEDSIEVVSEITERFLGAVHALYEPGLEVLSELDEPGAWFTGLRDSDEVRDGFERCVEWLRGRDLVEESVAEVLLNWSERRQGEEEVEIRQRWKSLEKYGESTKWVSFD